MDNPSSAQSDPDRPSRSQRATRKRKRVSVACKGCRIRKARCDGGHPKCTSCLDLRSECHYEQPRVQPTTTADDRLNSALEERVRAIERRLHPFDPDQTSKNYSSPPQQQPQRNPQDEPAVFGPSTTTVPDGLGTFDKTSPSDFQEDSVDGMGTVALRDAEEIHGFFGASSNVAFVRHVRRGMAFANNTNDLLEGSSQNLMEPSWSPENVSARSAEENAGFLNEQGPINPLIDIFALPSLEESDTLIRLYFSAVGLMIPCIHEGQFLETHRHVRQNGTHSARRSWLGIFNMILALAANITTPTSPTQKRARDSETYFQRALELARSAVFGRITFETVQFLSLLVSYLQGTARAAQTWTFHGLAVQGAYQLGLHSTAASGMLPLMERELRKRTWCWCIMNDRILSATLGRPCLIPKAHVRLDKLANIKVVDSAPRFNSSGLAFFEASLNLTHIMGETIDQLYDQNLASGACISTYDTLSRALKLGWDLAKWQHDLPADLQVIKSTDSAQIFGSQLENIRFRVLLSLRYLSARILALRPILGQFLEITMASTKDELFMIPLRDYGFSALRDMVNACIDIIFISNNVLAASENHLNLGAWWFSGHYTFNASVAILGVLLVEKANVFPDLFLSLSVTELRTSLSNALEILRGLDNGNMMILRCRDILNGLLIAYDRSDTTRFESAASSGHSHVPTPQMPRLRSVDLDHQLTAGTFSFPTNMNFGTFGGLAIDANNNFFNLYQPNA